MHLVHLYRCQGLNCWESCVMWLGGCCYLMSILSVSKALCSLLFCISFVLNLNGLVLLWTKYLTEVRIKKKTPPNSGSRSVQVKWRTWMGANVLEEQVLCECFLNERCLSDHCLGSVLPPKCTGFAPNHKVTVAISAFLYPSFRFTCVFDVLA